MNQLLRSEAAVTTGTATTAVSAVIALVVAFGLPLTMEQKVAILGAVVAVPPFVSGLLTRRHVWSQQSVEDKLAATARAAAAQPTASTVPSAEDFVEHPDDPHLQSPETGDPGAPSGATEVR